ncbi:hypothetical protein M1P56_19365 [Streptomyces sp. HU2014]|uniref:hypothetical protein n=1 Tax=Streptomyces sp. HU2014 TaxID=2939414 RepID=UPI0020105E87|nr:hypothetical protein [Streptomyces sp. HU2014]UQI46351.1 hypothetical protein M1P56_19365 [Streptomyces sp. HU2014]
MRPRTRPARRPAAVPLLTGLLMVACLLTGCAEPAHRPAPDEVVKAATQRLTDVCLTRQGLAPPRPGQGPSPAAEQRRVNAALFGTGRTELSVALPTGYVVRAHTDGCLAAAQRRLYGDQRRWFRTSVVVNNLRPEAEHTHRSLTEVRASHGAEIADWRRLRAHALSEATALLDEPLPTGEPRP